MVVGRKRSVLEVMESWMAEEEWCFVHSDGVTAITNWKALLCNSMVKRRDPLLAYCGVDRLHASRVLYTLGSVARESKRGSQNRQR